MRHSRANVVQITSIAIALSLGLPMMGSLVGELSSDSRVQSVPAVGHVDTLKSGYARWKQWRAGRGDPDRFQFALATRRGHRSGVEHAIGTAIVDLGTGTMKVVVRGLQNGESYEVWALVRKSGAAASAAMASRSVRLGSLESSGDLLQLDRPLDRLGTVMLDRIAVTRAGTTPEEASLLTGAPSLFQRLYVDERRPPDTALGVHPSVTDPAPFDFLMPPVAYAQAIDGDALDALVAEGENLFFNETFGGNGRTCGTCHRAENNFTIDPAFIATLPQSDPLFVAENNPDLSQLENPTLMRQFGLILANVDGLDDPTGKFVMRSVSHTLGLAVSIQSSATEPPLEMTGWSGDGAPGAGRLRDFATGAVTQHFPKSLDRIEGVDFRLPTESELDALEAFQLSLGRDREIDLTQLTFNDRDAERGRVMFLTEDSENNTVAAAKCNACHRNAGANTVAGINGLFDTGVEEMAHEADLSGEPRPFDGGFGTQTHPLGGFGNHTFNTASLWEAADTAPFFHHNGAATLEDAVGHYESDIFRESVEGQRLQLQDSAGREMSVDIDVLAAFLRAINVMENIRSATVYLGKAAAVPTAAGADRALMLAGAEIEDAMQVLSEGELHVEDVYPLLENAMGQVEAARAVSDAAERDALISTAARDLLESRGLIVVDNSPAPDLVAPSVAITTPPDGATVSGQVPITATASDDIAVVNVTFSIGFQQMDLTAAPFEITLDSTMLADGVHNIDVTATDGAGNLATDSIVVTVDNASVTPPPDTIDPTLAITAPTAGQTLSGTVAVTAEAFDESGIASVSFEIDGLTVKVDSAAPYGVSWDTAGFGNGSHTLRAVAQDNAGNSSTVEISVTIDNAPVICSVYSCPSPPPPPTEPPPPPTTPPGSSPDGELEGEVVAVDLQAMTITSRTGEGDLVTLTVTAETVFEGSVSRAIEEVLPGHMIQGEFFTSAGEFLWLETDMPPGF